MKNKMKFVSVALAFCFGVITTFLYSAYADASQEAFAESVIRLHVIANSDSTPDQNLKMRVRDAIVNETGKLFAESGDREDARRIICANMEKIEEISRNVVRDYGCDYPVRVTLGKSDFPTKAYGGVALPAGTYEALKVEIGEAEGRNWWCVLFPPLCFVDAADAGGEKTELLKDTLTDSEYEMITQNDVFPVKIKFKTYELWQESKLKIKNMLALMN